MPSGDGWPAPRRKAGSMNAGLWNVGPGFRRGDSESWFSSEGPHVQRGRVDSQETKFNPYAWVRNCDLCFFESEERPHVKEVNGAIPGGERVGRRAGPLGWSDTRCQRSTGGAFGLHRAASSGAECDENIVRTFCRKVNRNHTQCRWRTVDSTRIGDAVRGRLRAIGSWERAAIVEGLRRRAGAGEIPSAGAVLGCAVFQQVAGKVVAGGLRFAHLL